MARKRDTPDEIVVKLRQVDMLVARGQALAAENARLRRAVSELTPDKQILAEATRGNY